MSRWMKSEMVSYWTHEAPFSELTELVQILDGLEALDGHADARRHGEYLKRTELSDVYRKDDLPS